MNQLKELREVLEKGLSDSDKQELFYKSIFAEDLTPEQSAINFAQWIASGIVILVLIVIGYILY